MKAVVLNSGGLDSVASMVWAVRETSGLSGIRSLAIDYGQTNSVELGAAIGLARRMGIKHHVREVDFWDGDKDCSLINPHLDLTKQNFVVPGRNLVFLTMAAKLALEVGARRIVIGSTADDVAPDSSEKFINAAETAINLSFGHQFYIVAPWREMPKVEVIRWLKLTGGEKAWEAVSLSVSCYRGRPACGNCPACAKRAQAFEEVGYVDPARQGE